MSAELNTLQFLIDNDLMVNRSIDAEKLAFAINALIEARIAQALEKHIFAYHSDKL